MNEKGTRAAAGKALSRWAVALKRIIIPMAAPASRADENDFPINIPVV